MKRHSTPYIIRVLLWLLIATMMSPYLPMIQIVEALTIAKPESLEYQGNPGGGLPEIREVGSVDTRYGVVAILVEDELWERPLKQSIEQYAEDVQNALPYTKSLILKVDSTEEDAADVQRTLEKLYFEGDSEDKDVTQLSGVVVIGEVPLPVVNKNGHRFVSMIPYVDFEDPAYYLDGDTQDFLPNEKSTDLQPEIWHGVIVPPIGGELGKDMLVDYFEKNHAFHSGDEVYSTFDEKVFIGDYVREADAVNKVAFGSYQRFLDLWEETTYSQYSADLIEELYLELMGDAFSPGDGLDNDGDGRVDEEAANGLDEDGDGLIDEDNGDGMYLIDNDEDGQVDEDGSEDNNNDKNWFHDEVPEDFRDGMKDSRMDEDGPGDMNGDGCPGVCGVDDNGLAVDSDNDGFTSGWEILNGYDPYDPRRPRRAPKKIVEKFDGTSFDDDEAALRWMENIFTDSFYGSQIQHPSCIDSSGVFHPEWDDDEDGFCDEDPGEGVQLANGCLANDADCDGREDEDPTGREPERLFEDVPDVNIKPMVQALVSRYAEIFDQHVGISNRLISQTGRYDVSEQDYDTAISLISKKDEYVLQYLGEVNDYFETELTQIIKPNLAADVPMVAALQIQGTITVEDEDPEDFCNDSKRVTAGDACRQFINFTYAGSKNGFEDFTSSTNLQNKNFYIYGQNIQEIDHVGRCSIHAGTDGDGQLVEFNTLYSRDADELSKSEIKELNNCVPQNSFVKEDLKDVCNVNVATLPVRDTKGAIEPHKIPNNINTDLLEVGFGACYEFREMETWLAYFDSYTKFGDWFFKKYRKEEEDDDMTHREFLAYVREELTDSKYDGMDNPARKQFKELNILTDVDGYYTVKDIFKDKGWDFSEGERADEIDIYMAMNDSVTIRNPQYGSGLGDVEKIFIRFNKAYVKPSGFATTGSASEAKKITSFLKHTQPWDDVLNKQIKNVGTPDLPIDLTHRMSFADKGSGKKIEILYPNMFDAESMMDAERQITEIAGSVAEVTGGARYEEDVVDLLIDSEINIDQLEDALAWQDMSIDEKHRYMFTHYLGQHEPVMSKARNGYEMVSLILDGDTDYVQFGFNGAAKDITEEDWEFLHGSREAALAALSGQDEEENKDYGNGNVSVQPVLIFQWVEEMKQWVNDLQTTMTTRNFTEGGLVCGDESTYYGPRYSEGGDLPDGANDTIRIKLSGDETRIRPNQTQIVTVSARTGGGLVNTDDNFTEVELSVLEGDSSIEVLSARLQMTNGIANFPLKSLDPGEYVIQAETINREEVGDVISNTLDGEVLEQRLVVSSYVNEELTGVQEVQVEGELIEIEDGLGNVVAVFNPRNGDLELRGVEAELRQATETLPTRVAIVSPSGGTYGSLFMIPSNKRVSIGNGISGVFVNTLDERAEAKRSDAGVSLFVNGDEMGVVTEVAQVALSEDFSLAFSDESYESEQDLNLYAPLWVLDDEAKELFVIRNVHDFEEGQIEAPGSGPYQEYLTQFLDRLSPVASAEVVIPDSDGDLLDDLEEWAIGTKQDREDSDGDGVIDGTEIFSGTNPLGEGPLFLDMGPEHPAYADVVRLYLRGVLSGYRDGSMRPDQEITREDFVKVNLGTVCKLCTQYNDQYEERIFSEYNEDPFPDTDFTEETLACVADAKVSGIVDGYQGGDAAGYFLPQNNISWAEAIKVVVNTSEMELIPVVETLPWYATYVQTAYANRILPEDFSSELLRQPITRAEFAQMAMRTIEANDCRLVDTDGEGLSDAEEEYIYGTNPLLIDTDNGGVNDFIEVTRGSDPLDGRDDFGFNPDTVIIDSGFEFETGFDHLAGVYVVSDDAALEVITVSTDGATDIVKVFEDELPADGNSSLVVRAELRDSKNVLMSDDSSSTVEFVLSSAEHGEVASRRIQLEKGVVETRFSSSVISGDVQISAQLVDGSAAVDTTAVDVYAGDPVRTSVTGLSSVLPAGGESSSDILVTLFDGFGNISDHGFYTVTLETEGGLEILDLDDLDDESPGVQVSTPTGEIAFRVLAGPEEGQGLVKASIADVEGSEDQFSIEMMEGLQLSAELTSSILFVDSEQPQGVEVQLLDKGGQVVTGFNGMVNLSLNDPAYGRLENSSVQLSSGLARTLLYPGTLAGNAYIMAESTGIEGGSSEFVLKPGDVASLIVKQEDELTELAADEIHFFIVEGYDRYGNLVTTDSSTTVNLRLTDATSEYANLGSRSLTLNQGVAEFNLRTLNVSGKVNLVAKSPSLSDAANWSGDVLYQMDSSEFANIAPQMLYGSLLGAAYGKVTEEDYLGGYLTFNGKTQAITSLIDEPMARLPRVSIDARGSVNLPAGGFVTQVVLGASSKLPLRLQWRGLPDDELMAEVAYVMPSSSEVASGVTVQDISARGDLEVEEKNGEILVREDEAVIMKVRKDGQIVLLSESYNLSVKQNSESLQFVVMRLTEPVILVDTNSLWSSEVTILDPEDTWIGWRFWDAGVYILPNRNVVAQLEAIPTGNSTSNPKGYAILDEIRELPAEQQPSLGYSSLEGALDNGDIGWEGDTKHMTLFAAGNTAGQSNLFYPSEIGVLLGDPTVSLQTSNESNALGYTSDIGTMVSASNQSVLELMDIDYNGDGNMDVVAAYEDGRIELLQNTNSPTQLQNVGDLLFVENGIRSIDKGDFNGDGLSDILVVTETSCLEGEMCLYLYENIGGGFVAQNLSFSEIEGKPIQVVSADLNNDGYTDLTLVDENMVVYAVWNVEGSLEVVEEIENFGLKANPGENQYADVLIRTNSTLEGSASIPMETTNTSSSTLNTDIDEFISSISGNPDITVDLGESGGSFTRMESVPFEYANHESVLTNFSTVKSQSDENGGRLEVGDNVRVTLTTRNVSGNGPIGGIYLSDTVGGFYSDLDDTFACVQCSESNLANAELLDGDRSNPWVFGPLYLEEGEAVTLSYNMVVNKLPEVMVMPGQDIYTDYTDDNYLDLAVSLENNNSGDLLVYYSDGTTEEVVSEGGFLGTGERSFERVNYRRKMYGPSTHEEEYDSKNVKSPFADENENGIPDFVDGIGKKGIPVAPSGTYDVAKELLGAKDKNGNGFYGSKEMYQSDNDVDNDGVLDTIDPFINSASMFLDPDLDINPGNVLLSEESGVSGSVDTTTLSAEINGELNLYNEEVEEVADKIEDIVDAFTCNGGCLAFMPSLAFMSPFTSITPVTGTPIPDPFPYPLLGFGPAFPWVCVSITCGPWGVPTVFRMYLSPSTTLGLGVGLCAGGPIWTGGCLAYSVPLLQSMGVCDAINGAVTDALSKVSEYTTFEATISFKSDGGGVQAGFGSDGAEGLSSDLFADYEAVYQDNINIQVPGFPSLFTKWWKAQKNEFFKMLDLPDVTFIYPEWKSLSSEFRDIGKKVDANQDARTVELSTFQSFDKFAMTKAHLSAGIMGLEDMLNWAHSLPLLDIKTQDVIFKFPWITREEIELVQRDGREWLNDTETELERFLAQFCLGGEAPNENPEQGCVAEVATEELAEAIQEIEDVVNDLIAGVEQNLAVIESYARIPEDILQIRTLGAYYIKVIICYIDAILSFTAGYLLENTERIIGWIKFVMDLTTIIKGWQILIELALELMGSCDQCTNQRWSGIHILLSLFIFIPDLPVIELPKLPDIVIDVSQIQAGLDIVWPNIKFVPEPINIPELPRIKLPGINFNLDFDLDLQIPVLPEFDLFFELPPLPGLTLPNLPNLPPPPKVPELMPAIQAALNIASNIIRVICVIRMGFIPVPEWVLKQKIEDITQRPGGLILPIDISLTVEWPEFSFEFLERIDVKTYVNLTFETPALYELLNSLAEKNNEITGDVDELIEEAMQKVADDLQSLMDFSDIQLEVDASVEGTADFENPENSGGGGSVEGGFTGGDSAFHDLDQIDLPAVDVAIQYKDHPLVSSQLEAFNVAWKNLDSQIDEWAVEVPDDVMLVATERVLALDDPLLNRYDDIIENNRYLDTEFLARIEGSPLSDLADIRENMIAHVENMEYGTERLQDLEGTSFLAYLADEYAATGDANPIALAGYENAGGYSMSANWNPEVAAEATREETERLIAAGTESDASVTDGLEINSQAEARNIGIFILNEEEGVAERLVDYTAENEEATSILFMDLDNDGDEDVVYSMGGDVYVKKNNTIRRRDVHVSSDPNVAALEDYKSNYSAVHNLENHDNNHQESSFNFKSVDGAVAYDVSLYDSLDASQAAPDENVKRLLLVENDELPAEQIGDSSYASRPARVYVNEVRGKVKLMNGFKRTLLQKNAELTTDSPLEIQTLESSVISVENGRGKERLELPAHQILQVPAGSEQIVRIESGSALWIESESIDEQDLIEGSLILLEEQIVLESRFASVQLMLAEGATLELDKEELFAMDRLLTPANPAASIGIENGAYYSIATPLYEDGGRGIKSAHVLMNPQICGDESAPFALIDEVDADRDLDGDGTIDLAIYATAELSAGSSFDEGSQIHEATWDFDAEVDADGNGVANDDEQYIGLNAEIGPYDSIGLREVTVSVKDLAGNAGTATIDVNVFVPNIYLSSANESRVTGGTDLASPLFPYDLVRERNGAVQTLRENELTDEFGGIDLREFDASDLLSVYNHNGDTVAQFNPESKQALAMQDGYSIGALPSDGQWPSRLIVFEEATAQILASFIVVANEDLVMNQVGFELDRLSLQNQSGITYYFHGDEENYTSTETGLFSYDSFGNPEVSLTQDGNLRFYDERFEVKRREAASLEEELVLEVYDDGVLEFEFWPGNPLDVTITDAAELELPDSNNLADVDGFESSVELGFKDILESDVLYENILEMVENGILQGYLQQDGRYFRPNQKIQRSEFTKIILSVLCIEPRAEAYALPPVFNDVDSLEAWYFAWTKEANLLGLIEGYIGERDEDGFAPFKPSEDITRAEAAKIVVEALELQNIITIEEETLTEFEGPWYTPYIELAVEYNVLTPAESLKPNEELTRYDFVEMAARVLALHNCFEAEAAASDFDPSSPLDLEPGIYAVRESCYACPCEASIDYESELRPGDTVFAIIRNSAGDIFGISNKLEIEAIRR